MNEIKEKVGNEYKTRRATYRRLITVGGVEYPVPEGYTLLEYIESTGSQYIDTGLYGTQNTRVEETLQLTSIPTGVAAHTFGDFTTNAQAITMNLKSSGNSRFESTSNTDAFGTIDTNKHTYGVSKNGFTLDGVITKPLSNIADFTTTKTLLWMSSNFTSVVASPNAKYYELKIWENSELIRNLIPAKNSDNVLGMYDFVTNQFFQNAGTGVFTAGNALPNSQLYKYVGEIEKKVNGVYKEFSMGFPRTVSGASPITLPDARAKALTKNKIYGNTKRTFDFHGVSYPIPSNITILDKIETDENATTEYSSGGCYLDTGIAANAITKVEIVAKEYNHNSQQYLFGAYQGSDAIYIDVKDDGGIYRAQLGEDSIDSEIEAADGFHDVVLDVSNRKFAIDGTEIGTFPSGGAAPSINAYALGMKTNYGYYCTSFYHRVIAIWKSTGLAFLGVSAKNASNVVGLYDFISGAFNAPTTGTATAGNAAPNPDMPLGVKGVGEKTENLTSYILNSTSTGNGISGTIIPSLELNVNWEENTQYTFSFDCSASGVTFSAAGNLMFFIIRYTDNTSSYQGIGSDNYQQGRISFTTSPSKTIYAVYSINKHARWTGGTITICNLSIVKGSTAPTTYIPYGYKIEELLASNCGCVDLGTLNWNSIGNGCFYTAITGKANGRNIYCSKYPTDQVSMASATANMHIGGHEGNRVYFKNTTIEPTRAAAQNDLSGEYLYYQRTDDATWTPPTKATAYLDNDLQGNATIKDTFDFANGVDTDAWEFIVLDGVTAGHKVTDIATAMVSSRHYYGFYGISSSTAYKSFVGFISNYFKTSTASAWPSANANEIVTQGPQTSATIFLTISDTDTDRNTVTKLNAWFAERLAAGNPVWIGAPKATPSTTQKTAVQVTPAKGTNYLAVDGANIEATYIKKEYSAT